MSRTILPLVFMLCFSCCREEKLHMRQIVTPDYPVTARFDNIQGTVTMTVTIDPEGKVIFAKGSGAPEVLVKAAEENARKWLFGPFPPVGEYPIAHTIQYVYILEGKPKTVELPPAIKTFLPDRIEIKATPLVSDYPPLNEYKPIPRTK